MPLISASLIPFLTSRLVSCFMFVFQWFKKRFNLQQIHIELKIICSNTKWKVPVFHLINQDFLSVFVLGPGGIKAVRERNRAAPGGPRWPLGLTCCLQTQRLQSERGLTEGGLRLLLFNVWDEIEAVEEDLCFWESTEGDPGLPRSLNSPHSLMLLDVTFKYTKTKNNKTLNAETNVH